MTRRARVTMEEMDCAFNAVREELAYQDALSRRTADEAKDIAGFLTLLRRYLRHAEDHWADNAGPITPAHDDLRKLAAICIRAMAYCGVQRRT